MVPAVGGTQTSMPRTENRVHQQVLCSLRDGLEEANDDLRRRVSEMEEAGCVLKLRAEEERWERVGDDEALVHAREEVIALEHRIRVLEGERGALRAREEEREGKEGELARAMAANERLRCESMPQKPETPPISFLDRENVGF